MQTRNIRSVAGFIRGMWDWTFLNDCFVLPNGERTKIRVSDVDGLVEKFGHFLFIEVKPERNDDVYQVTKGQSITHQALIRTGVFTVMEVWGTTDTDMRSEYLHKSDTTAMLCALGEPNPTYARILYEGGKVTEGPITKQEFHDKVHAWFTFACQKPNRSMPVPIDDVRATARALIRHLTIDQLEQLTIILAGER